MARENDFHHIDGGVSQNAVSDEAIQAWVNREAIPLLRELRARMNQFMERPEVPIFATAPVTDASYEARGYAVRDGSLSFCAEDSGLYVRNGSETHVKVIA